MSRKPPQEYTLHREQDGALVGGPYPLATARAECARCNAEARVIVRQHPEYTEYASMYLGEVSRYEVRSADGLVIA